MPFAPSRPIRPVAMPTALVALSLAAALLVPGSAVAAVPEPPTPSFPPQIEPYPRYEPETECDPVAKPGAVDLAAIIKATYGSSEVTNISRGCTGTGSSGHHSGRAIDWMTDAQVPAEKQKADAFVAWLLAPDEHGNRQAMARRLGINYVVWNSRKFYLFDAEAGWTEYSDCLRVRTGPADDNYCHRNHVHVSMQWAGARRQTSWWTGGNGLTVLPQVDDLGAVSTEPDGGVVASPDDDASVLVRRYDAVDGLGLTRDLGGATMSAPALVRRPDGRTETLVVGTNGALYSSVQTDETTWTTWLKVPGASLRGRPAAVAWPDGTLHVFAAGADGTLWQTWRTPAGAWGGWRSLGGAMAPGAGVSAAAAADTTIRLVVRGTDSQAWVKSWAPGRGWQRGWSGIGGIIVADPAVAADETTGSFVVVARGTNDAAYANELGGTAPLAWVKLGGALVGSPAASTVAGQGMEILLTGTNGLAYRKVRQGGTWSGWAALR